MQSLRRIFTKCCKNVTKMYFCIFWLFLTLLLFNWFEWLPLQLWLSTIVSTFLLLLVLLWWWGLGREEFERDPAKLVKRKMRTIYKLEWIQFCGHLSIRAEEVVLCGAYFTRTRPLHYIATAPLWWFCSATTIWRCVMIL